MSPVNFTRMLMARQFPLDFPGHWLSGTWHKAPKADVIKESYNPSRDQKLVEVRLERAIVNKALDLAASAEASLAMMSWQERLELVAKLRQVLVDYQAEIVLALRLETGKPLWDAQSDFAGTLATLDRVLANPEEIERALLGAVRLGFDVGDFALRPIGLTVSFLPFSNPCSAFVHNVVSCLLSGCPLVIMASGHATVNGIILVGLVEMIGLPKNFLSVLFGNFTFFRQMAQDRRVQAIIYNGSREHCETLRKESHPLPQRQLLLQSAGKNAVIVDHDANIPLAIQCILMGVAKTASQLCSSTSRVFVHADLMEEVSGRLLAGIKKLRIGPTDGDDDPQMGPLYSKKAIDKFLRFQTMAKREAKKTLLWGRVHDQEQSGYFVQPGLHVIDEFDPTSAYQSNVIMAPDVSLFTFKELETALKQANGTDAPLVISYMGDPDVIKKRRRDVLAPNILLNLPTVDLEPYVPVAGRNQAGNYRCNGLGAIFLLTYPQVICDNGGRARIFQNYGTKFAE